METLVYGMPTVHAPVHCISIVWDAAYGAYG